MFLLHFMRQLILLMPDVFWTSLSFITLPLHGSWLNMAEIELSVLSRQCLERRIPDKEFLQQEVAARSERRSTRVS